MGPASGGWCSYKKGRGRRDTEKKATWRWRKKLEWHIYKPWNAKDCWQAPELGERPRTDFPQRGRGVARVPAENPGPAAPPVALPSLPAPNLQASPARCSLPSCHHIPAVFPSPTATWPSFLWYFAGPVSGFILSLTAFLMEVTSSWNVLLPLLPHLNPGSSASCPFSTGLGVVSSAPHWHLLPLAALTKCHPFRGLEQERCILSQFWSPEVWSKSHWAEVRMSAGLHTLWKL